MNSQPVVTLQLRMFLPFFSSLFAFRFHFVMFGACRLFSVAAFVFPFCTVVLVLFESAARVSLPLSLCDCSFDKLSGLLRLRSHNAAR